MEYNRDDTSTSADQKALARFSLKGKNAVITGGASGLGLESAFAFLEHGAEGVLLLDVSEQNLNEARSQLEKVYKDRNILIKTTDVTKPESVQESVDYAAKNLSSIDIVLPFAGIATQTSDKVDWIEAWKRTIDVNLNGVYYTAVMYGDKMAQLGNGGSIILVASIYGHYGSARVPAAYCASKGAMLNLKTVLADKYIRDKIRVNSISPAFIETRITQNLPDEFRKEVVGSSIMPRFGFPTEITGAVILLASQAGSFMTGTDVPVDGGYMPSASH